MRYHSNHLPRKAKLIGMSLRNSVSTAGSILAITAMLNGLSPARGDQAAPAKTAPDVVWTPPSKLTLWYDHPAADASAEGLPVGDGFTCCRIAGGVTVDDTEFQSAFPAAHGDNQTVFPAYLPENMETEAHKRRTAQRGRLYKLSPRPGPHPRRSPTSSTRFPEFITAVPISGAFRTEFS